MWAGRREGGELKSGKNVLTSFMDDDPQWRSLKFDWLLVSTCFDNIGFE